MSDDLDPKGLEAAMTAFRKAYIANPVGLGPQSIEAAIRAYLKAINAEYLNRVPY